MLSFRSGMMKYGIEHLVDSAVHSKSETVFYPQIEVVVKEFLGIKDEPEEQHKDNEVDDKMDLASEDSQDRPISTYCPDDPDKLESEEMDVDVEDDSDSGEASNRESLIQTFQEIEAPQMSPGFVPSEPIPVIPEHSQESLQNVLPSTPRKLITMQFKGSPVSKPLLDSPIEKEKHVAAEVLQETEKILPTADKTKSPTQVTHLADQRIEITGSDKNIVIKKDVEALEESSVQTTKKEHKLDPLPRVKEEPLQPTEIIANTSKSRKSDDDLRRPTSSSTDRNINHNLQKSRHIKVDYIKTNTDSKRLDPNPNADADLLSDVSSVHTSDLSDFDDQISLSSGEDDKKRISLQEGKQLATDKKHKRQKKIVAAFVKKSVEGTSSTLGESSSMGRRERKVNPRYASDDYASMFNRRTRRKPSQESILDDISTTDDEVEESVPLKSIKKEKIEEPATPPVEEAPIEEEEAEEPTSAPPLAAKQTKRRPQKRSERYDASDLYKPRPSIGSSRRNRGSLPNAEPQP